MTEDEARQILYDFFARWLQPGQVIWIGKGENIDDLGYSFPAGVYNEDEGKPDNFPLWGVDAATKKPDLMLLQTSDGPDESIPLMSDDDARMILSDYLKKLTQPGEQVYLGKTHVALRSGYNIFGSIFTPNKGIPEKLDLWWIDYETKEVSLALPASCQ